jgi:hypothetical protein
MRTVKKTLTVSSESTAHTLVSNPVFTVNSIYISLIIFLATTYHGQLTSFLITESDLVTFSGKELLRRHKHFQRTF